MADPTDAKVYSLNRMNKRSRDHGLGDLVNIKTYTSSAGAGGAATEAMTLTGLGASDTILAVSQSVDGANSLPLLGYNTQAANSLTCVWSADPGAGAVVVVTVRKSGSL